MTFDSEVPASDDIWEACGAAALTAFGGRPPGDVAGGARQVARALARVSDGAVTIDGPAELARRSRWSARRPHPRRTLRGSGRMLRMADGWVAVNLPRPTDLESLPALTLGAVDEGDVDGLEQWARKRPRTALTAQARLLDVAAVAVPRTPSPAPQRPFALHGRQPLAAARDRPLTIVDMSSLWAGPLAAGLLAGTGAHVVKVEGRHRPENPDPEDAQFYAELNGIKERRLLDFEDRSRLHATIAAADVAVFSSRPRALERLGLHRRPGQLWLCITAYGHRGDDASRIGFGDDVAAAAGAVFWHDGEPHFCADALADPLTGMMGALAVLLAVHEGIAGVLDVHLFDTVSWAMAPTEDL